MGDFGGDSFEIVGFLFSDLIFCDGFAGKGVPEENFFAGSGGSESLTAWNDFFGNERL